MGLMDIIKGGKTMTTKKKLLAGLVVGSFVIGVAVTANATPPPGGACSDDSDQVVVTGAYRCPGNFIGFQHSIAFTTSDLGDLNIETEFSNLDTGDCTPRGQTALGLAKNLGCTVGPLYAFQRGGGAGAAFGFVCTGKRSRILHVIEKLSGEILRPTQ
jgi:hypothetical protein